MRPEIAISLKEIAFNLLFVSSGSLGVGPYICHGPTADNGGGVAKMTPELETHLNDDIWG